MELYVCGRTLQLFKNSLHHLFLREKGAKILINVAEVYVRSIRSMVRLSSKQFLHYQDRFQNHRHHRSITQCQPLQTTTRFAHLWMVHNNLRLKGAVSLEWHATEVRKLAASVASGQCLSADVCQNIWVFQYEKSLASLAHHIPLTF